MSKGYDKLKEAVEKDCVKYGGEFHPDGCVDSCYEKCSCFHKYCNKFKWAVDKAKAYGEVLELNWEDVLDSWENDRNYWYMNYYQECNQPKISGKVKVLNGTGIKFLLSAKNASACHPCGKVVNNRMNVMSADGKYMDSLEILEKAYLYTLRKSFGGTPYSCQCHGKKS